VEVDAALSWRWLIRVEYVSRLDHEVYPVGPDFLEATKIEECGVSLTVGRLDSDIVDLTVEATCELTAPQRYVQVHSDS